MSLCVAQYQRGGSVEELRKFRESESNDYIICKVLLVTIDEVWTCRNRVMDKFCKVLLHVPISKHTCP
jgi:hypothetical protein